jgi:hypothetical protein
VTSAFDLTGKLSLAAGAVPSLATWANFATFGDETRQCIVVFVIEAFTIWTILYLPAASSSSTATRTGATI